MEKQKQTYKIHFECVDEFIIIPVKIILEFLNRKEIEKLVNISIEEIFPDQYMEYLEKVLNVNRHLPEFSYKYIKESPINENGIMKILLRQLKRMKVNGIYCFEEVKLFPYNDSVKGFKVKFSIEFLDIYQGLQAETKT